MEVLDLVFIKLGMLEILLAIFALLLIVVITNICSLVVLSKSSKKKDGIAHTTAVAQAPAGVDVTNDLELVAVITAAIAAQQGTSTDSFVVRSIRRRPSNAWK